jgi:hypothetical protein
MTRVELETQIEEICLESATLSKKERDRLVENLVDHLVDELHFEVDDEEEEEDDG